MKFMILFLRELCVCSLAVWKRMFRAHMCAIGINLRMVLPYLCLVSDTEEQLVYMIFKQAYITTAYILGVYLKIMVVLKCTIKLLDG